MNALTSIYVLTEFTDGDFDCVRLFSTEEAMLEAAARSLIEEYEKADNKALAASTIPEDGAAIFTREFGAWQDFYAKGEHQDVVEAFHVFVEEHVHNHPMPYGIECEEQLLEDLQPAEAEG